MVSTQEFLMTKGIWMIYLLRVACGTLEENDYICQSLEKIFTVEQTEANQSLPKIYPTQTQVPSN